MLQTPAKRHKDHIESIALDPLIRLLKEGQRYDSASATETLGLIGNESAIEPLRKAMAKHKWFETPKSAAIGIALIGGTAGIQALKSGKEKAVRLIKEAYEDGNPSPLIENAVENAYKALKK